MKKIKTGAVALALTMFSMVTFAQVQDIPEKIQSHFKATYPAAVVEDWDKERDGSYEVEFSINGVEWEAYYSAAHEWLRTERDVKRSDVPQAVLHAIAKTDYASWKIDDIEEHHTPEHKSVYEIEVEKTGNKAYVYLLPDGTTVKLQSHNYR